MHTIIADEILVTTSLAQKGCKCTYNLFTVSNCKAELIYRYRFKKVSRLSSESLTNLSSFVFWLFCFISIVQNKSIRNTIINLLDDVCFPICTYNLFRLKLHFSRKRLLVHLQPCCAELEGAYFVFSKIWNSSRFRENPDVILFQTMYHDRRHQLMKKKLF